MVQIIGYMNAQEMQSIEGIKIYHGKDITAVCYPSNYETEIMIPKYPSEKNLIKNEAKCITDIIETYKLRGKEKNFVVSINKEYYDKLWKYI